jgi:hypothetical protein
MLQEIYNQWLFFRFDNLLVEMAFAMGDRITSPWCQNKCGLLETA